MTTIVIYIFEVCVCERRRKELTCRLENNLGLILFVFLISSRDSSVSKIKPRALLDKIEVSGATVLKTLQLLCLVINRYQ